MHDDQQAEIEALNKTIRGQALHVVALQEIIVGQSNQISALNQTIQELKRGNGIAPIP